MTTFATDKYMRTLATKKDDKAQGSSTALYTIYHQSGPSTIVTASSPERTKSQRDSGHVERFEGDSFASLPLQYAQGDRQRSSSVSNDSFMFFDGTLPDDVKQYLYDHGVHVERIVLKYPSAHCFIRVLDIAFAKRVFVRFTCDGWKTSSDVEASYIEENSGSATGTCYFCAILRMPPDCESIEFAVCYQVDGKEYWDNCDHKNYKVHIAQPAPRSPERPKQTQNLFTPPAPRGHVPFKENISDV